jgi:hypothetical protein
MKKNYHYPTFLQYKKKSHQFIFSLQYEKKIHKRKKNKREKLKLEIS